MFGRKDRQANQANPNLIRATALVIQADAPYSAANIGHHSALQLLVNAAGGPVSVVKRFKPDDGKRWLVTGMEVPVELDPHAPDQLEVDWGAIPSIEERVAANDRVLVDPRSAQRRVAEAMQSAGLAGPNAAALSDDRFQEALDRAAGQPASDGKMRALAVIVTQKIGDVAPHHDSDPPLWTKAVLAVHVPGREPYAVFKKHLHIPHGRWDVAGAGIPALVSEKDPNDVELLWREMPSVWSQVAQRMSDEMQTASVSIESAKVISANAALQAVQDPAQRAYLASQYRAQNVAFDESLVPAPPASDVQPQTPAPGATATPQINPAASAAMIEGMLGPQGMEVLKRNANYALQFIKDPAQRQMLIEQYKRAGIPIDEGNEAP